MNPSKKIKLYRRKGDLSRDHEPIDIDEYDDFDPFEATSHHDLYMVICYGKFWKKWILIFKLMRIRYYQRKITSLTNGLQSEGDEYRNICDKQKIIAENISEIKRIEKKYTRIYPEPPTVRIWYMKYLSNRLGDDLTTIITEFVGVNYFAVCNIPHDVQIYAKGFSVYDEFDDPRGYGYGRWMTIDEVERLIDRMWYTYTYGYGCIPLPEAKLWYEEQIHNTKSKIVWCRYRIDCLKK